MFRCVEGENPVPETETLVPGGPLFGERVIDGVVAVVICFTVCVNVDDILPASLVSPE